MKTITNISQLKQIVKIWRNDDCSIGFVPTMGCLHQGHLSLVEKSKKENDYTIVSIYVNPLQFGPNEDFDNYPRTPENDLKLLQGLTDLVFIPNDQIIYPNGRKLSISENRLSLQLCGSKRPGHFDGVLQVVLKLLNIVNCHKLYLGSKDYQQYLLLDYLVKELFLDVEVIACPIIREADHLALSSRNRYLNPKERSIAPKLYQEIRSFGQLLEKHSASEAESIITNKLVEHGFIPDYISILQQDTLKQADANTKITQLRIFAAAKLGKTRLIDNLGYLEIQGELL